MKRGLPNRSRHEAGNDGGSTPHADPQERPDVTLLSRALTDAGLATYLDTRVPSGCNAYSPAGPRPTGAVKKVADPDEALDAQLRVPGAATQGQPNILNLNCASLSRIVGDSAEMDQPQNTRRVQASRHLGALAPNRAARDDTWYEDPLEGPALPRWIPSSRVDSTAMLSAFLHHRTRCSLAALEPLTDLYLIEHRMGEPVILGDRTFHLVANSTPGPVHKVPCLTPGCTRCGSGHGGYKFKWYSERWSRSYDHLRRPNTWVPGDPEDPSGPQDVHPQGFRMPAERTSTNPRRMDSRQAERDYDTHIEGLFHSDTRSATEPICARCNDPAPASRADGHGHICEER